MYVASDSHSDLPVFPLLERASRHDMLSFLHSFFTMKAYLPEFHMKNFFWILPTTLILSMNTADRKTSHPLSTSILVILDISLIRTISPLMRTVSPSVRWAYVCIKMDMRLLTPREIPMPKADRKRGCFCEQPCSPAKYGRTVHIFTKDNPRLFNIPPRDSKAWEKEYDGRTSVERSNKREKEDYKLEDGRHRSTKMWYCRLYGIMMLQHLDAWKMPSVEAFQESLLGLPA